MFLSFLPFPQTESLKCVAQASKNRSLADFEKVGCSSTLWPLRFAALILILHSAPPAKLIVIIATNGVLCVI